MKNYIKFIYFDVGGVVVKDFSGTDKWEELKLALGVPLNKDQEFEDIYDFYHDELNTTREIDSLIPIFKERLSITVLENYSLLVDGFVKRFEKNIGLWPVIKEAKSKYKIGLLTNMYPNMLSEIKKASLLPVVEFDQIVDSSIERVQKPDREIYELAEKRCGFKGGEILFIDNTKKHLDAAKELGWQTFLYDSSNMEKSNSELLGLI